MNPLFEPFLEHAKKHGSSVIKDEANKDFKPRYTGFEYTKLSIDDFLDSGLPFEDLEYFDVTFQVEGHKYTARLCLKNTDTNFLSGETKPSNPIYFLLNNKGEEHGDAYWKVENTIRKNSPVAIKHSDCDRYFLKKSLNEEKFNRWLTGFIQNEFSDISIRAEYKDLLVEDEERTKLEGKIGELERFDDPQKRFNTREAMLKTAYKHAENATGELKEENIILVHPHHEEVEYGFRHKKVDNINRLVAEINTDRFGVVLVDSIKGYVLRSHEFVDQDKVAEVIFTKDADPDLRDGQSYEKIKPSAKYFFGGVYGNRCVRGYINRIKGQQRGRMIPIKDAIVYGKYSDSINGMNLYNTNWEGLALYAALFGTSTNRLLRKA